MIPFILRVSMLLALAANLASCVPKPHVADLRPAVSGILLEDGEPVSGVELFLGKFAGTNEPCTDVGEIVTVSPEGKFSWAPIQAYRLTDSLINAVATRGTLTVLCIRHPKIGVLIGVTLFVQENNPVSLRLLCDVAHPRSNGTGTGPHTASAMLGQAQYCVAAVDQPHG